MANDVSCCWSGWSSVETRAAPMRMISGQEPVIRPSNHASIV